MSEKNQESISDIVSEMREFADTDSQTIGRDVLRKRIQDFARRIEQSVTDCNRIGNFAKILEALEKFNAVDLSWLEFPLDGDSSTIYNSNKKEITIPYWRVSELLNEVKAAHDMAKAALSAPPRNCDLFETPKEAGEAFMSQACENPCGNCTVSDECNNPLVHECGIKWLFSEAKGDKK